MKFSAKYMYYNFSPNLISSNSIHILAPKHPKYGRAAGRGHLYWTSVHLSEVPFDSFTGHDLGGLPWNSKTQMKKLY